MSKAIEPMRFLSQAIKIDIEFQDLTYTVPHAETGSKVILRSVSGKFKAGHLNAILGPSGAGKSTLLNVLAGFRCDRYGGTILVNGKHKDNKILQKLSRYIMQQDLIQPMLSVQEAMMIAANLKLGWSTPKIQKLETIAEILRLLRLTQTANTRTELLSGGERKRLAIALELINNPSVIFLDEPTTGLDELSCKQCVSLLKQLAEGGRTIICAVHTPSARLFNSFDNAYFISEGQCVYQGPGPELVQYLEDLDLDCPKTFNPADYIIELCCDNFGEHHEKLVNAIDNGRLSYNSNEKAIEPITPVYQKVVPPKYTAYSKWTNDCYVLLLRMWLQMWRDKCYLFLRVMLYFLLGILVGNLYLGMGNDGSKTIFNFGFYFTCLIFFMYIPMMPVLLHFPKEIQLIRREYFNKWYSLSAYFVALSASTIPIQLILGCFYLTVVYVLSDQPLELDRMSKFYTICLLNGIISESLGMLIASNLSLINAMFIGPVVTVPILLLSVYGWGYGYDRVPKLIQILMHFSYLRYSMESLINVMLVGRGKLECPEDAEFCIFTDLNYFVREMGMDSTDLRVGIAALVITFILFRMGSYYLLRQRLRPSKTCLSLKYIGDFVKTKIGMKNQY